MPFTAATAEQRFVLDHVAGLPKLTDAGADVIDAVLGGIGELAAGEWAPLNRKGDTVGAKLTEHGVVMPEGFAAGQRVIRAAVWSPSAPS